MQVRDLGKESIEFRFFNEFWKFLKTYYNEPSSDVKWRNMFEDCKRISKEYEELNDIGINSDGTSYDFANKILIDTLYFIEAKEIKENKNAR